MGSREVPFEKNSKCDGCGAIGAFDFMGDYLCPACAKIAIPSEDNEPAICEHCGLLHCEGECEEYTPQESPDGDH